AVWCAVGSMPLIATLLPPVALLLCWPTARCCSAALLLTIAAAALSRNRVQRRSARRRLAQWWCLHTAGKICASAIWRKAVVWISVPWRSTALHRDAYERASNYLLLT